jgi:hypothetical protein
MYTICLGAGNIRKCLNTLLCLKLPLVVMREITQRWFTELPGEEFVHPAVITRGRRSILGDLLEVEGIGGGARVYAHELNEYGAF